MVAAHAANAREIAPLPHGAEVDRSHLGLDELVARHADRCFGVLERSWLLSVGLTRHEIDARLRRRWLRETAFAGVYVLGHLARVPGQREALALCGSGPDAVLAGSTAGSWQRLHGRPSRQGPVELIVPRRRGARVDGVRRRTCELEEGDVHLVRGLRCTTPARTVMDLPPRLLREALQELMRRAIALEPIVERMRGRRGAKRFLREVSELVPQLAHTMSELEARFVRLCARWGIEAPVVNGALASGDLLDCTWPGRRLVVELDGRRWHQHRDREDRARDRRRVLEGLVPARYGWWEVVEHERRTALEVGQMLRH